MYKIHVSLGKIVNQFTEQERSGRRSISRSVSMFPAGDDKTMSEDSTLTHEPIKEEEISDQEEPSNGTIRQQHGQKGKTAILDLLADGE